MDAARSRLDESVIEFLMRLSRRQFDTSGQWPVDLSRWEDARASEGFAGEIALGRSGGELTVHGIGV